MSGRRTDQDWGLLRGEGGGVFSVIEAELERVCALIRERMVDSNDFVSQVLGSVDFCGGKLLRPGLVLLSGGATGGIGSNHIAAGAMVELLHNASLLHDDVIDGADERRGQATVNAQWNNTQAVLLGDYVLGVCFGLNREVGNERVGEMFCETARSICRGEMVQNLRRGADLSEGEYLSIIEEKTARFFASCCEAGSMINGCGDDVCRPMGEYGLNLGLAFQIMDDVLDIEAASEESGKTGGRDAAQRKMTLAVIDAMDKGGPTSERIAACLADEDTISLCAVLAESGSLEYARKKAGEFCERAAGHLSAVAEGSYKDGLLGLCEAVAGR